MLVAVKRLREIKCYKFLFKSCGADYASLCRLALIPGVARFAGYRRWRREGRARRLAVGGACKRTRHVSHQKLII